MKKFECNECTENCIIYRADGGIPIHCVDNYGRTNWHEVKEDSAENEHTPVKSEQLPDWCKAGKWGYDTLREKYFEIVAVRKPFNVEVAYLDDAWTTLIGIPIFNVDCVQAHERPFNAAEMQALIGKRYETSRFNFLITGYDIQRNAIKVNELWFNSEDLMDEEKFINLPLIDGKPCYKLEHLNEKGEWVE